MLEQSAATVNHFLVIWKVIFFWSVSWKRHHMIPFLCQKLVQLIYLVSIMLNSSFRNEHVWWIVFVVWLTDKRRLVLFPAGTIARDSHHRESLTHHEQDLNLPRTWGLVKWSCAVVITTTPWRHVFIMYSFSWLTEVTQCQ